MAELRYGGPSLWRTGINKTSGTKRPFFRVVDIFRLSQTEINGPVKLFSVSLDGATVETDVRQYIRQHPNKRPFPETGTNPYY